MMAPAVLAPVPPSLPKPKPLTKDGVAAWKRRLMASVEPMKRIITEGRTHTLRYQGLSLAVTPTGDTVVVPLDYSYTEQKKAQVFFQVPELHLEAKRPDCEAAVPLARAVANDALSADSGVNAKAMMFETLTDTLCGTGFGVTVIGYTPHQDGTKPMVVGQRPVPVVQPGAVLGLSTTTQTEDIIEDVPNIIAESYHWDRIPPGFFRAPAEFRGSDFDKAPWLAHRFADDVKDGDQAKRGSSRSDDENLLLTEIPTDQRADKRWGTRVWYRAAKFDADAKHPDHIRTFVLYDDETEARDLKNSPYQKMLPDGTLFGMKGYPIHVLTLRYLSDAWAPKSDVAMSRGQVDELSKGRTQMVQRRDRSLPQVGYDATRVDPATLAKIEKNENTGFVGFNGPLEGAFQEINKGNFGRENFTFDQVIKSDIDQVWALGASAGVLRAESPETATKSSQIQSAVETRLEAERGRGLDFFVAGAMKLFALKQLFSTSEDYVRVLGPDGEARLTPWTNAMIPGHYAFKAKPDSHIRIDAAQDREQKLRFYNLTANDPFVNRMETTKMIATAFGLDPARLLKQPDPKGPEPATGSISFKIEDFIGPGAPIAAELAAQCGYKVSPQAMQAAGGFAQMWAMFQAEQQAQAEAQKAAQKGQPTAAQTAHGGAAEGIPPVDKHASEITGGRTGPGPL